MQQTIVILSNGKPTEILILDGAITPEQAHELHDLLGDNCLDALVDMSARTNIETVFTCLKNMRDKFEQDGFVHYDSILDFKEKVQP